eukprot:CAMPEP_0183311944 /NCGR_PEP_ID=MMETSP0160_2-20130417/39627_1 /TAXON_ID=2839 ORGANISM="Odontella Sinensis, Strain Grunow 1884" /NCGR_SAMPLE_ID=MMETSP0160_2 /ASSEMBLY_ACC=CAM_ASM_000250 /LENGTH=76 /DNA_ID=CAMNT_0025476697 /DNA_START=36 /DNA_END=266 /DNA_ORIENTATION=+
MKEQAGDDPSGVRRNAEMVVFMADKAEPYRYTGKKMNKAESLRRVMNERGFEGDVYFQVIDDDDIVPPNGDNIKEG